MMRKIAVGIGIVALVGLGGGLSANQLTNAQDATATPSQLLVCGTPFATPETGASPAADAAPMYAVDSTPMAGIGVVQASPGTTSSGTCTTEPS